MTPAPKVVAAWDRPNGTTVFVYDDGRSKVVIIPHDADPVRLEYVAVAPPTPAAPTTPEPPVIVADAPEGTWLCRECPSVEHGHTVNHLHDERCFRCGSAKP